MVTAEPLVWKVQAVCIVNSPRPIIPAVATDNSPLVVMLAGLASNVQQAFGPLIAVLIHMEVQIQVALFGQGKHPATALPCRWAADDVSKG